jgi:ABC-type antimicrobial peptide transport system permease subunit
LEQEPTPHVYEWSKQAGPTTDWVIRTTGDPTGYVKSVRLVVREIESGAAISNLISLKAQIELQTSTRRFRTSLLGLFAALAIFLAAVGIYGVMSYAAGQRTQEIGIRMALGAQRSSILWLILRQALALASLGLTVGTTAAVALSRLISSLLFGVTPADPLTFAAATAVLLTIALGATLFPALRATQIDPLPALRTE